MPNRSKNKKMSAFDGREMKRSIVKINLEAAFSMTENLGAWRGIVVAAKGQNIDGKYNESSKHSNIRELQCEKSNYLIRSSF